MKKNYRAFFLLLIILSLAFSTASFTFAGINNTVSGITIEPTGMTRVSISATRTTTTSAKIVASGSLTSMADTITTTATLYEYNAQTGALTKANTSPIVKSSYNCTSYSFNCSFSIVPSKSYKVRLEIEDYTNGTTNNTIAYSPVF